MVHQFRGTSCDAPKLVQAAEGPSMALLRHLDAVVHARMGHLPQYTVLRKSCLLRPGDFVFVPQSRISKIRKYVPASAMNWYLNPLQF